jgi:spoIIIJ-associated protein
MDTITVTGKNVAEAVQKGLEELGIREENAQIDILTEPSQGFLGLLGSKQAEVKISVKKPPLDFMQDFLVDMLRMMGLKGEVDAYVKDENILCLDISGPDMGVLIGKRGQTLSSLQYLLNIVFHKEFKNVEGRLLIDVEGYRSRREKTLQRLAVNLAEKVVATKQQLALEPMNPQDRRIIHTALQDNPAVTTYSEGEEPHRKVIISLS